MRTLATLLFIVMVGNAFAIVGTIDHVFTFGPSAGSEYTVGLTINSFCGENWNASTIEIETFNGVTIISPIDNLFGEWSPPFPDPGNAIDTYLRSPSAPPLFLPQLRTPSYSPTYAVATWLDPAGTISPPSFLGARVGLNFGTVQPPRINLSGLGKHIANVMVYTAGNLGGSRQYSVVLSVYDGVPEPGTLALFALAGIIIAERGRVYSTAISMRRATAG